MKWEREVEQKKLVTFAEVVQGKEKQLYVSVFKRHDKLPVGTGISVAEGLLPSVC